jgi:cytochrome c-type biogenesis protein CcmF
MIRFIWLGCLVMALGGLVAASDRRYRMARAESRVGEAAAEAA